MNLITLETTFTKNTSLQVGDTIYYLGTDSKVYKLGPVQTLANSYMVCNAIGDLSKLTNSSYIFFSKDNSKNISGLIGYYMEVILKNKETNHAELFSVNSQAILSS